MRSITTNKKLAALWVASFLFSTPAWSSEWDLYGFGGTHAYLDVITASYGDIVGPLFDSGSSGGGSEDTERADRDRLTGQWTLGIGAQRTVYEVGPHLSFGVSGEAGVSYARYSMPDGAGVFVEPITIKSTSLFAAGRAFGEIERGAVSVQTGVGLLASQSYETFTLGSWTIKERQFSTEPFGYVRGAFSVSQHATIAIEATRRASQTMASLRLEIRR
ncbi:hypothetical protein [Celeribacter marinus]|uniref:Uncharacterized protein n=1 Tax=Celeribacter marinus TaxID=1397108 RepID=A0A0N9ZRY6_9RHOB|nr:hypothetical protein [Celeribacter marinus]ALI56593.1 hypothetical protein IMCC12053_2646 [Celeribacter marinus]SFK59844.1 hypothetical protein SAMN05444421_10633 [Celeribacter marinus]